MAAPYEQQVSAPDVSARLVWHNQLMSPPPNQTQKIAQRNSGVCIYWRIGAYVRPQSLNKTEADIIWGFQEEYGEKKKEKRWIEESGKTKENRE